MDTGKGKLRKAVLERPIFNSNVSYGSIEFEQGNYLLDRVETKGPSTSTYLVRLEEIMGASDTSSHEANSNCNDNDRW
jgi:hypothetical protein